MKAASQRGEGERERAGTNEPLSACVTRHRVVVVVVVFFNVVELFNRRSNDEAWNDDLSHRIRLRSSCCPEKGWRGMPTARLDCLH